MPHDLDMLGGPWNDDASSSSELGAFGITGVLDFDQNMQAIADLFNRTEATTPEAKQIKNEFAAWYAGLGWWEKTDVKQDETFTKARNFRDRFNVANKALTTDELKERQKTGVTYEKAMGLPEKARTDSGLIAEPPAPAIPTIYKVAAAAGVAILAVLAVLKRI